VSILNSGRHPDLSPFAPQQDIQQAASPEEAARLGRTAQRSRPHLVRPHPDADFGRSRFTVGVLGTYSFPAVPAVVCALPGPEPDLRPGMPCRCVPTGAPPSWTSCARRCPQSSGSTRGRARCCWPPRPASTAPSRSALLHRAGHARAQGALQTLRQQSAQAIACTWAKVMAQVHTHEVDCVDNQLMGAAVTSCSWWRAARTTSSGAAAGTAAGRTTWGACSWCCGASCWGRLGSPPCTVTQPGPVPTSRAQAALRPSSQPASEAVVWFPSVPVHGHVAGGCWHAVCSLAVPGRSFRRDV
jgi:hypothetical protein